MFLIYRIHGDLKEKIRELNQVLLDKYSQIFSKDREFLRDFIGKHIGPIDTMKKLDKKHLALYQARGGIVGVDGSTNTMGGAFPHFVQLFQGLAKSTLIEKDDIFMSDLYSPLFTEASTNPLEKDEEVQTAKRNKLLSDIELKVALESVKRHKPYGILMDGSLIRYNIYSADLWKQLRQTCEEEGILLVGVIKDIKTSTIGDMLKEVYPNLSINAYDRELLFGILDYGEIIYIRDQVSKKYEYDYSSVFMRSSQAPTVIGVDIIDSQKSHIEEMSRLVYTLTPENSRGVPLWLDLVDKEVQISDTIMEGLMEKYMDRGIYERFFISERVKRN
ncbi:MAG: DNA double-strand break repair nuclease NurA [Tissierellaceae bacterium]|nr:DNA double-strand break repair nuclease NurA [Tissierellaceae bacterium]